MASRKVGSLLVEIATNQAHIRRDVEQVKNQYKRMSGDIQKSLGPIGGAIQKIQANWMKFSAAFGGGYVLQRGIRQISQIYQETTKAADSIAKFSKAVGISTESLSALEFAAERSGASVAQFRIAMRMMLKNMEDAAQGVGEAKNAIISLGLSAEAEARKKPEEMFLNVASALEKIPRGAQQVQIAMRLFGESGSVLLPMLNEGEAGIRALMERARELGIVIGTDFALQGERAQDAMKDLDAAVMGLKLAFGNELAPSITSATEELTKLLTLINKNFDRIALVTKLVASVALMRQGAGLKTLGDYLIPPPDDYNLYDRPWEVGPQIPRTGAEAPQTKAGAVRAPKGREQISTDMDAAVDEFRKAQEEVLRLEQEAKDIITELTLGTYELKKQELQRWLAAAVAAAEKAGEPADIYYEAYNRAMSKLAQEQMAMYDAIDDAAQEHIQNMQQITDSASHTMASSITNFASSSMRQFDNMGQAFASMITSMIADIGRLLLYESIIGPIKALIGGALGVAGAGGKVGGGVTTLPPLSSPNLLYSHSGGLAHDEVPAILQAGEFVVQRDAVSKMPMQFWEGLNRMHTGGKAGAIQSFDTGGAVKYGPFNWRGQTYTSAMLAAIHGGVDPRAIYGPGWQPMVGSPLNPMAGSSLSPDQILRTPAYKIWEERNRPPDPGPIRRIWPLPPSPGPTPGPSPYIPMPTPDYPPDFPETGPDVPWEFLPINRRVQEKYVPKAAREMYEAFGYDPWAGIGILTPDTPQWNRWEMPRLGSDLGKFMETYGMNVRGDWSMTPEMYRKFGGMTEPLAALSLLSGIRMDQLASIGEVQKLIQGYEATPFDIRGVSMRDFAETGSIDMSGLPAGAILSELMEALYFRLGVGGTMVPEHLTTDYDKMIGSDWTRYFNQYWEGRGKVKMMEGNVNVWGDFLGHQEALGTRIYYDAIINEAMKYMKGPGAKAGYMSGVYPDWVHYGHEEGGASAIGHPGAWLPRGILTQMHQGGMLRANEFPAILERGEIVLPKYHDGGVVGSGGGSGGGSPLGQKVTINIINKTPLQVEAREEFSMSTFKEMVKTITLTAVRTDPAYRAMMRG